MKKYVSFLLAMLMLLSFAGCGVAPESAEKSAADTHTVVDHSGNEVEVPYKIDRIVVCDILPLPSVLTIFFDSAEKIVGMADTSMNAAKGSLLGELYPEILNAETGFIEGSNINMEELLKLQPDVVFYSAAHPEQGEQLRRAGLPGIAISASKWEYDAIETLNNWISLISEMFPDNSKAEIVEKYSDEVYNEVQQRVAAIAEDQREQVFFLFKYSETNIMTSGNRFFGQWWADSIGAKNVGQELDEVNEVTVNMEQVYAWNPSLIFVTNFTAAGPEDLYNNTVGVYDWSAIDAVENQRVYKMPLGMYRSYTAGVDTPVTLLWLAKTAYPDVFADIDIIAETRKYYKEVFGIDLTDAQAASIFAPAAEAGSGF